MNEFDNFLKSHDIPTLQTHPNIPSISKEWFIAKYAVEALGKKWNGEQKILKSVPEHMKAILMGQAREKGKNTWCLSKQGLEFLFNKYSQGMTSTSSTQQPPESLSYPTKYTNAAAGQSNE